MSAFIVLSIVLAVAVLAVTVVVVFEVLRNIRNLAASVSASTERLVPLTDELQAELAVTSVEIDGLTRAVERMQKQRAAGATRRKRSKSKRKR